MAASSLPPHVDYLPLGGHAKVKFAPLFKWEAEQLIVAFLKTVIGFVSCCQVDQLELELADEEFEVGTQF